MTDSSATPIPGFLGIPGPSDPRSARFAVLPAAYEGSVSWGKGASRGPAALLEASRYLELWDEELGAETHRVGIATMPEVRSEARPADFLPQLEEAYDRAMEGGRVVAMIGGEHSVTLAGVRGCLKRHDRLSVLQLDAHADLREEYEGSRFSHACVMRRVSEVSPIVQVGIRSLSPEEVPLTSSGRVATHFLHEGWPDDLARQVSSRLSEEVYVTVDLDVFDPGVLPATGTPEPGGIDWVRAVALLREVASRHRIVGFDVVELAPIPGLPASDFLAAKLTYRLMGYVARSLRMPPVF